MSIELAAIAYRERKNQPALFDGVYRPEPWLSEKDWRAVAYRRGSTLDQVGDSMRDADHASFEDEERAQARCDELNATRMDVSASGEPARRLI